MIQANELRIGNALEYFVEDSLSESEWILNIVDADDIALACKDKYFNKYYRSIPLTPEILEKCGAIVYEFDNGLGNQYRIKDRLFVIRDGNIVDYGSSVIIKHLHQLQNLYFALTGEELNYTP